MSVQSGHFRRIRPFVAAAAAATLVLGVVGPARAQEAPTGEGTSNLTVVPVALDVDGLPVEVDTTLGALVAEATNDGNPVARLALEGLAAAGDLAPSVDYSTTDGDQQGNESHQVGAGGVSAALDLVDWAVRSDVDSAVAELSALGGELTTPIGLDASVDAQQITTSADPTAAASAVNLTVTGVDLGLDDLLPAELLEALPLGTILDLLNTLGIPLSAELLEQVSSVDELQRTLEGAVAAAGDLADAQALLDDAIAGNATLDGLQDAVTSAAANVTSAQANVASLESQIASLQSTLGGLDPIADALQITSINNQISSLNTQLTSAQATLASAEAALAAAEAALDDALNDLGALDPAIANLLSQVNDLRTLLEDLLKQIDGLLVGLDLSRLRLDLLDALTGASLLDLGTLSLDLSTVANGTEGLGSATCAVEGLTVLGTAVPAPSCDDIGAALSGLGDTIGDALAVLPVSAPVPAVTLAGPTTSASGQTAPDADGITKATSSITALSLGIAPVDLTAVVDDLIAQLDALVAELDALLAGVDVPVDSVLGGIDLSAIDPLTSTVAVPTGLGDALGQLRTLLDSLPLGDALDGLSTLGVGADVGTVVLSSAFSSSAVPAAPGAPGTPGSPDTPSLPSTGSSDYVLLMAALAALMAGVTTRALGRSFELGLHRAGTRNHR